MIEAQLNDLWFKMELTNLIQLIVTKQPRRLLALHAPSLVRLISQVQHLYLIYLYLNMVKG